MNSITFAKANISHLCKQTFHRKATSLARRANFIAYLRDAGTRSGKRILRGNFRSRPEGVYTYTERKRAEIEQKSRIKRRKPQVFNLRFSPNYNKCFDRGSVLNSYYPLFHSVIPKDCEIIAKAEVRHAESEGIWRRNRHSSTERRI